MDDAEILGAFRKLMEGIQTDEGFAQLAPLLAHYTSITVLESILRNEQLWFSNPLFMNDTQEIRFGINEGIALFEASEYPIACTVVATGGLAHLIAPISERIEHTEPWLTLHGLRRSFGTLSEWVECPVGVVAQIQGHKPSATAEKHYRRRPLDLLRMWHVKIEGWILEQAGIEQPGEEQPAGLRVVT